MMNIEPKHFDNRHSMFPSDWPARMTGRTGVSRAGLFNIPLIDLLSRLVYLNVYSIDQKARSESFADIYLGKR